MRNNQAPTSKLQGSSKEKAPTVCAVCKGLLWVCENHPMRPWDEKLGCVCGAGRPCECNGLALPMPGFVSVLGSMPHMN